MTQPSSKIEEIAKECKEGDENSCKIFFDYLDFRQKMYLHAHSALLNSPLVPIIATVLLMILKIPLVYSILVLSICAGYVAYSIRKYLEECTALEWLYSIILDTPANLRSSDTIILIGAIAITALSFIIMVIMYLLHYISLV